MKSISLYYKIDKIKIFDTHKKNKMSTNYDANIIEAIRVSAAPIFLISGIGIFLKVLVSRKDLLLNRCLKMKEQLQINSNLDKKLLADYKILRKALDLVMRSIQLIILIILLTSLIIVIVFIHSITRLAILFLVPPIFILIMINLVLASLLFFKELKLAASSAKSELD